MDLRTLVMFLLGLSLCSGAPVSDIVGESSKGVSGTITIVGDAIANITDLTVDGISDVQKEFREFFEEQLENRVEDVADLNEAVGDVAQETVSGLRSTANAVEEYVEDSFKDAGRFTDTAARSTINGLVDTAEATGGMARDVASTAVDVWTDTGNAWGRLAGNLVDNGVRLANSAGKVWRSVARNAVKALTKYDYSRDDLVTTK